MSQGNLKYPIQQFLRRLIPPFESSRTEFVQNGLHHSFYRIDKMLRRRPRVASNLSHMPDQHHPVHSSLNSRAGFRRPRAARKQMFEISLCAG